MRCLVLREFCLKELSEVVKLISQCFRGSSILDAFSTLLVLLEEQPMGRILLSKRLGIGERRIRSILSRLEECNLIERDSIAGCFLSATVKELLEVLNIRRYNTSHKQAFITVLGNVCREMLECLDKRIVEIRDNIVIMTSNPKHLLALGFSIQGELYFPRVEGKYYNALVSMVSQTLSNQNLSGNYILVLWNNYKPWIYDAITLLSLYNSCCSS